MGPSGPARILPWDAVKKEDLDLESLIGGRMPEICHGYTDLGFGDLGIC